MQFTSVTSDDAMVALHDCDNDVNAAIDLLLEGDDQGKWQESTKKKKKPVTGKVRGWRNICSSSYVTIAVTDTYIE